MRFAIAVLSVLALSACTSTQVYRNPGATYAPTTSAIAVFYSPPQRPHEVLGVVSATKWRPGWTDPGVSAAIPQLQSAAAAMGADAVIVRQSRSNNDRHVVVEAEAIRYTDRGPAAAPSGSAPAAECEACKKIGGQ